MILKSVRDKMIVVRMNEEEYCRLETLFKETTCRTLSDYLRKICLARPVIVKHRNKSLDEILAGMIQLKKELNSIGNNYNQAVHKLHTLDHIPEIKAWLLTNESCQQAFIKKVAEIKDRMNQIYEKWSQI